MNTQQPITCRACQHYTHGGHDAKGKPWGVCTSPRQRMEPVTKCVTPDDSCKDHQRKDAA